MTITCRKCGKEYEYEEFRDLCPHCGSTNAIFRSGAAQGSMGTTVDEYGRRREASNGEQRYSKHFQVLSRDPDNPYTATSAGTFRRIRPYLILVLFAAGVVILGTFLMKTADRAQQQNYAVSQAQQIQRKPIGEYASASFNGLFDPVENVSLQVNYTGTADQTLVPGLAIEDTQKLLFIDVSGWAITAKARERGVIPGTLKLMHGDTKVQRYLPTEHSEAAFHALTPLSANHIKEGMVTGQLFFVIPNDWNEFTLCWIDSTTNKEQRMELHL